jgi:hypothetical protein
MIFDDCVLMYHFSIEYSLLSDQSYQMSEVMIASINHRSHRKQSGTALHTYHKYILITSVIDWKQGWSRKISSNMISKKICYDLTVGKT